jgi:predicted  nucleic acid-binding Zn-ribbon protein
MAGVASILKELHRLRRHMKDLDAKIEQAPRQLTVQKARLAKQEDIAKEAHETVKQIALSIREKEGSIKAVQQQIVKYEKQLNESAGKKEYETLKKEIAQEKEQIGKIEDEILAAIARSEELTAQLPEVDKTVQKARDDFAQFEKGFQERLDRFSSERTRAQDEVKTTEATLPDEIRIQYERLGAAKGTDALASVKGRTCTACYIEITSQMIHELSRGVFILCKNCGRMLYVDE